jgi:hypothetical protein
MISSCKTLPQENTNLICDLAGFFMDVLVDLL